MASLITSSSQTRSVHHPRPNLVVLMKAVGAKVPAALEQPTGPRLASMVARQSLVLRAWVAVVRERSLRSLPTPRSTAMSKLPLIFPAMLSLAFFGCGPVEIRVSKAEGVHSMNGSLSAHFNGTPAFTCGDTITGTDSSQSYVVTTAKVNGGCDFTFDQQVQVLAGADYETIKEFKDAVHFLNRVELNVTKMDFYDDEGNRFDIETRLRDLQLWVNGQQLLDVDQIKSLPKTVVLTGDALKVIKDAVKNRKTCTAHVVAKVTVLDTTTPTGIRCEYESQPTFVLSSSEI
jgi:hypothetical protein